MKWWCSPHRAVNSQPLYLHCVAPAGGTGLCIITSGSTWRCLCFLEEEQRKQKGFCPPPSFSLWYVMLCPVLWCNRERVQSVWTSSFEAAGVLTCGPKESPSPACDRHLSHLRQLPSGRFKVGGSVGMLGQSPHLIGGVLWIQNPMRGMLVIHLRFCVQTWR